MDVWSPDHLFVRLTHWKEQKDWTAERALQKATGGIRPGQGKSPFSPLTFLIMDVPFYCCFRIL
jgi:hypothetical protein